MTVENHCALCGGGKFERLFSVPGSKDEKNQILRCERCQIVFLDPKPHPDLLSELYAPDYYGQNHRRFEPGTEFIVYLFTLWRVFLFERYLPSGGKVLEIGCGRGNFLSLLAQRGYGAYGTELSESSAARARSQLGDHILVGKISEDSFQEASFDMVVLWHVLEHLYHPREVLQRAHRFLKEGGKMIVALPNFDSWQSRWSRQHWFHLDVPRHLFHFSPKTLKQLLVETGYKPFRKSFQSVEQNPFGMLQSLLNVLGFRKNSLYNILRRRQTDGKHSIFEKVFYSIVYVVGMFPMMILATLESFMGRGGTFYVVAEARKAKQNMGRDK